jgi:hypothetical protein
VLWHSEKRDQVLWASKKSVVVANDHDIVIRRTE